MAGADTVGAVDLLIAPRLAAKPFNPDLGLLNGFTAGATGSHQL